MKSLPPHALPLAVCLWVAQVCTAASLLPVTGEPVHELAAFDEAMAGYMTANGIWGGALAVMKDGQLVLEHGYGWKDRSRTTLFDPQSRVRIASNSKSFTAAAVKVLIEQGRLKPDTLAAALTGIQPYNGVWCGFQRNRTPVPISSGHDSGRCRTAFRSLPDSFSERSDAWVRQVLCPISPVKFALHAFRRPERSGDESWAGRPVPNGSSAAADRSFEPLARGQQRSARGPVGGRASCPRRNLRSTRWSPSPQEIRGRVRSRPGPCASTRP